MPFLSPNQQLSKALREKVLLLLQPRKLPGFFHDSQPTVSRSNEKSVWRRCKHCALAAVRQSQKFRPAADPLPVGARRPKFNQLEMVTTFTYKPGLVRIDTRNFELSWWQTHPHTNKQTGSITIHCAAASLAHSVIMHIICTARFLSTTKDKPVG